jgi:hypothetical protein
MRRLCALLPCAAASVLLCGAAPAGADVFGPISLVSESPSQQADYAHNPVISGDGRYVALDGSYGGETGVWRRAQSSGAVEQVAGGDAELPSISDDGRYVSFTTTAALSPQDSNVGPDVYVRDMSLEASQPGAFTLASAADGSEQGLSYQGSSEPASFGSLAIGRSALSGDGRKVAFVTTAVSDLIGRRPPEPPETPAMQVAVRDLDTHTTQLVSVVQPVSEGGAAVPVSSGGGAGTLGAVYAPGGSPPAFRAPVAFGAPPQVGASISADGSTVSWLAQNITEQAPVLSQEASMIRASYSEPLWRRIADGPRAPTRRVTGGSDPANPACQASGETALSPSSPSASDPCQGPFATFSTPTTPGTWAGGEGAAVPRLSADGYTVAFLANAPLIAAGSNFGRAENHSDLYVADMHEGLTRVQALRQLTELASGEGNDIATNADIMDLGISADGKQVAFTTRRTVFPLGSPAYVSAPATVPGMLELFDVDLADDTLTRVTQGFEGGASEHPHATKPPGEDPYNRTTDGALAPSFTSDGHSLAFSSTAANLVYGDGNTPPLGHESLVFDGSDAFAVARVLFGATATEGYISSAPAAPAITPVWRLGATAVSRPDGTVLLDVAVPGAGVLSAGARSAVLIRAVSAARGRRRPHGRPVRARLATKTVATRTMHVGASGLVTLSLKLAGSYAALAGARGGLAATVTVHFGAAGQPVLHETLVVTFRRTAHAASRRRARRGSVHRTAAGRARR